MSGFHIRRIVRFAGQSNTAAAGDQGGWEAVRDWCAQPAVAAGFEELLHLLKERHAQRVGELQAAAPASAEALWWPFTQVPP